MLAWSGTQQTVGGRPKRGSALAGISGLLRTFGVWMGLGALLVFGFLAVPQFSSEENLRSMLTLAPPLIVVALGQTFVIAVGGLDLSVGMLMGLVGVLSVGLMAGQNESFFPVILLVLCLAILVGVFNGVMVAWTRVNPIILTFGMFFVLQGASYLYAEESIGPASGFLRAVAGSAVGGLPLVTFGWVILALAAWILLARTRVGQHIRAVGGNEVSAQKTGIRVDSVRVIAYALSGLSGGIAGLLLASRLDAGYALAGQGMELNAIVAVLIGGTPYGGGRATIVGTVAGALLLSLFRNELNLLRVAPYVQQVAIGTLTVIAVAFYSLRRRVDA